MTRATRKPAAFIEQARQVRGLRSPLRQEIVDALQAEGPCTVAELGARLERAPDSLYYHIRALLRLGLLVERDGGEARGLVVDVPSRPMKIRYHPDDRAQASALRELVGAMLRLTERDFRAGLSSPSAVTEGPQRNLWAARMKARLAPEQLARVGSLLREIADIMVERTERASARSAQLVALTFVLAPVTAGRRPRRGTPAAAAGDKRKKSGKRPAAKGGSR